MPRDSAGNYTLPAGNPVISGTIISSSWANTTMDDLALAMTDSLSRTGSGGMLAPLYFPNGTENNPSCTFVNGPTFGMWFDEANDELGFTGGGDGGIKIDVDGQVFINALGVIGQILAQNGVVGAPAFAFTGDPSTGMFRELATGDIVFSVAGVELFRISSPDITANGAVRSNTEDGGIFTLMNTGVLTGHIAGLSTLIGAGNGDDLTLWGTAGNGIRIYTDGNQANLALNVPVSGRVLINSGVDDGTNQLQVSGSLGMKSGQMNVYHAANFEFVNREAGGFVFYTNSGAVAAVTIIANGNMLVGLTSPVTGAKLEVAGSISAGQANFTKLFSDDGSPNPVTLSRGGVPANFGIEFDMGASFWVAGVGGDGNFGISPELDIGSSTAFHIAPNGNVLIGKNTDDTVNSLQVSGGLGIVGAITEQVFSLGAGTALSPVNGTIQYDILTGNKTYTLSMVNGQSLTLMVNPATFAVTWPVLSWVGGIPDLKPNEWNAITIWNITGIGTFASYAGAVE